MVGLLGNGGCDRQTLPSIYVLGLYQGFVQGAMFNKHRKVAYGSKKVVSQQKNVFRESTENLHWLVKDESL